MPNEVSVPYIFAPNTKIKSSEVNADFSAVSPMSYGYKVGYGLSYVDANTLKVGKGLIEVNGKFFVNNTPYNINWSNLESGYSEESDKWYYVYLDDANNTWISPVIPIEDYQAGIYCCGRYIHPYHSNWRAIGKFYNNPANLIDRGTISDIDTTSLFNIFGRLGFLRKAIKNSNFDIWFYGTSWTNPATNTEVLPNWIVEKDNGAGTAPSVNIIRDSEIPNFNSTYSLKCVVTNSGVPGSNMYWRIVQKLEEIDWKKYRGKKVSLKVYVKAPLGGLFQLYLADESTFFYGQDFTGNGEWKEYSLEGISVPETINALKVCLSLARGVYMPTTGAYYFSQVQLNEGEGALPFMPDLTGSEFLFSLWRWLSMFDGCPAWKYLYTNPAEWDGDSWYTIRSYGFSRGQTERFLRIESTFFENNNASHAGNPCRCRILVNGVEVDGTVVFELRDMSHMWNRLSTIIDLDNYDGAGGRIPVGNTVQIDWQLLDAVGGGNTGLSETYIYVNSINPVQ
ncbi:MAG: hypothetical protein NC820_07575 [Candidatus Omnitrophica bacterium]|nr:hypothetical protein [Candidatus Omnitrophota bacterium]